MTRHGGCDNRVDDILMGWPLGSSHNKGNRFRIYVRDPENVFGDRQGFATDVNLPKGASDTGYRQKGV